MYAIYAEPVGPVIHLGERDESIREQRPNAAVAFYCAHNDACLIKMAPMNGVLPQMRSE